MHPSVPKTLRFALILSTAAALLAAPFPALGAKGADLEADVQSLITRVSPAPDGLMAFTAVFDNTTGSSTIAHLRFDGKAPGATFVSGPCDGGGDSVSCDIGNLASGGMVSLTFLFEAPATLIVPPAETATVTFTGTFSGDAGQGNGSAAKDDIWEDSDQVTVDASGDFFGRWQPAHNGATFATDAIGGDNHQSTTVQLPAFGRDSRALIHEFDDSTLCGIDGFGQAVDLSIADGDLLPLTVTLLYDGVAAEGRSAGQVQMLHDCEPIPSDCRRSPDFCFKASWAGRGANRVLQVVVTLPHNGSIKGI